MDTRRAKLHLLDASIHAIHKRWLCVTVHQPEQVILAMACLGASVL